MVTIMTVVTILKLLANFIVLENFDNDLSSGIIKVIQNPYQPVENQLSDCNEQG